MRRQPPTAHPRFAPPAWLLELYERQEPPERVLAALCERLRTGEVDLHTAYRVVNDIGRLPDGATLLERADTLGMLATLPGRDRRAKGE